MAASKEDSLRDPVTGQTPNADGKVTYEAACHCHAVEYTISHAPLNPPFTGASTAGPWGNSGPVIEETGDESAKPPLCMDCNCSICLKNGYLLIYPQREDVVFTKGYDTLRTYQFATRTVDHKFCGNCGSSVMIDFRGKFPVDALAMNARMIKHIDVDKIQPRKGDGRRQINAEYNDQTA